MKILPKIFIASSSLEKAKDAAKHLKLELNDLAEISCWFDKGVFQNGEYTLPELLRISHSYDMGIFIFNDDDQIKINTKDMTITRDNVILEYGMFVSVLGPKRCFIVLDENIENFRIPTDVFGLTTTRYNSKRELNFAMVNCIETISKVIKHWEPKSGGNKYFERFYLSNEPTLENGSRIEYNRSFDLLLYMFGNESFKEFRAFDLAFSRWEEAFTDSDKVSSQIINYSKDILATTGEMYRRKKCDNFRRIVVISTLGGVTKKTIEVLNLIDNKENEVIKLNTRGVFQTRVLGVSKWDHKLDFNKYNDFAMFTGEFDEFAIVEFTLNSPYSNASPGKCVIEENDGRLLQRKEFFDEIWTTEAIAIKDFINIYDKVDKSETISRATKLLHADSISNSTGIIIETAYVELIKVKDNRRNVPFERAFDLLTAVNASNEFKGHIFLDSFINDFRPKSDVSIECSESCEIEDLTDNENFRRLKNDITKRLNTVNSSFNISDEMITTFYMTKTRDNAIKHIKKLLTIAPEKFFFEDRGDGTRDIYLKSQKINLGYQRENNVTPNCALLMAEHYYELFEFVTRRNPSFKDIWIFDFLIYTEKIYVEQGAKTAVSIYDWPNDKSLNIVNCSYSLDGTGDMRHLGPFNFSNDIP